MSSVYHPDLRRVSHDDKYYSLTMFPYPSGYGLHVGHASAFTINDVNARYQMLQGKAVLNPMGFDSFGLPTENYAMKVGKAAHEVTSDNILNFERQIEALDMSFDPERSVATSDPSYYHRTQWLFQQLYQEDMVYRAEQFVNWCPSCQTVLANDQVVDGKCERCKSEIIQKKMPQWFVKTTAYADELIQGLDDVDRPEHTKTMQRNWIGRSEGTQISFYADEETPITIFTTRIDTIYGVTALVLAPENTVVDHLIPEESLESILDYRKATLAKTAVTRQQGEDGKSGVFSGVMAFHPLTHKHIPIWYADYVLPDYATGSVMLVPAHDARDRDFAQAMDIPYITVLDGEIAEGHHVVRDGQLINSDQFSGMDYRDANQAITDYLIEHELGRRVVNYKLRDRSISRQRYRGCPIPVYYDDVPVTLGDPNDVPVQDAIVAIVRDPINNLYLTTNWSPSKGSKLFVYGNKGDQETFFEAAKRHIRLDTGYDELDLVDRVNHVHFTYTSHEGEDRAIRVCAFLFDLVSDHQSDDWKPKADRFVPEWIEPNSVASTITGDLHTYVYEALVTGVIERSQTTHLIPEEQLPVLLPLDVENYKPAGVSPLAEHPRFPYYQVGDMLYRRECDTLDTFVDSSFYFLRYPDVENDTELVSQRLREVMFPIDMYVGGAEHTVGHLLYARFVMRFLYHTGYVSTPEPFQKLVHQGMVIGSDGRKMSKRRGNVIDPLDVIQQYDSDTLRTYLLFMGPVEQDKIWDDKTLHGVSRFLSRVRAIWTEDGPMMSDTFAGLSEADQQAALDGLEKTLHQTIQGITRDMEAMKYNTVVSKLMILVNAVYEVGHVTQDQYLRLMQLLSPLAPTLTEQQRRRLDQSGSIFASSWPVYDEQRLIEDEVTIAIQVNGKMRGTIDVDRDAGEDAVIEQAIAVESVARQLEGKDIKKVIFIPNKILNLIVA